MVIKTRQKNIFQSYVNGWRCRIAQQKKMHTLLYSKTLEKIEQSVRVLSLLPSIEKVILFGSVLYTDSFNEYSDIDLAYVGSVPARDYFFLINQLEDICAREVNLVDLENCSKSLRRVIEEDGKTLYSVGGKNDKRISEIIANKK